MALIRLMLILTLSIFVFACSSPSRFKNATDTKAETGWKAEKESFLKNVKAEINDYGTKAITLREKSATVATKVRSKYKLLLNNLEKEINQSREALNDVENASGDTFEKAKDKIREKIKDLSKTYHSALTAKHS